MRSPDVPVSDLAVPAADWRALVDAYRPGDSFLAFPSGTLLGQGVAVAPGALPAADQVPPGQRLRAQAAALLAEAAQAGVADPVLMGVVPFDTRAAARWQVPQRILRAASPAAAPPPMPPVAAAEVVTRQEVPAREAYEDAVSTLLRQFAPGALDKVVLARALDLTLREAPDAGVLLRRLVAANPRGYTYAIGLGTSGAGQAEPVFIGASPELLVRREGTRVVATPLAGSAARRADAHADAQACRDLAASAKDAREHALVVQAVAAALQPLCRTLDVPARPTVVATDALWHLSTTLSGELADPATTSLDLALALHPTPAVCGWPTDAAFAAIQALEPFDRGPFAGFVGWCDATGDGEWSVALRCARWHGRELRLFAGAGIVPGSAALAEGAETGTKFRTLLSALGLTTSTD